METSKANPDLWWCLRCEAVVEGQRCPNPKCGLSRAEQYGDPVPWHYHDPEPPLPPSKG